MNIVVCGSHRLPKTDKINQQIKKGLIGYLKGIKDKNPEAVEKLNLHLVSVGKTFSQKLLDEICEEVEIKHIHQPILWDKYPNKHEAPKETHDEQFRKAKLIFLFDYPEDEYFTEWVLDTAIELEIDVRKYKVKNNEES